MKAILKAMVMTAALAVGLVVLTSLTRAEEAKTLPSPEVMLKALANAGKPGPEHQKLQPLVGDWTFTLKMWTDPSQPPAELKGTVERHWILGGRFVQETVRGECNGNVFEGLGLVGYDNGQKKFTTVRACGLCGNITNGVATCSASGARFECATESCCPLTGQKISGRDELIIESKDRIVTNVFRTVDDKEMKVMELVSIRKK